MIWGGAEVVRWGAIASTDEASLFCHLLSWAVVHWWQLIALWSECWRALHVYVCLHIFGYTSIQKATHWSDCNYLCKVCELGFGGLGVLNESTHIFEYQLCLGNRHTCINKSCPLCQFWSFIYLNNCLSSVILHMCLLK